MDWSQHVQRDCMIMQSLLNQWKRFPHITCCQRGMAVELQRVQEALAAVQQQKRRMLKAMRRKDSTIMQRRQRAWKVAIVSFCHMPEQSQKLAEAILRSYADSFTMSDREFITELERRFLATPVEQLANWLDWQTDLLKAEQEESRRLVADLQLLAWIEGQNTQQGLSPTPGLVWEQRCLLTIQSLQNTQQGFSKRGKATAGAIKWVQRFKQRWKLLLGRLPTGEIVPLEEMRKKVMQDQKKIKNDTETKTKTVPKIWAHFWDHK